MTHERLTLSTPELQDRVDEISQKIRDGATGQLWRDLSAERRRIETELHEREVESNYGGDNLSHAFHLDVLNHLRVDAGVTGATFEYPGYISIPMADGAEARVGQHGWDYASYCDEAGGDVTTTVPVYCVDESDPSSVALGITTALDCRRPLLTDTVGGDWNDESYPARIETGWSGGVSFATDRETLERIVRDQDALIESLSDEQKNDVERLEWRGDMLVLLGGQWDEDGSQGYTPADDGLYHGLGFGWTWVPVDDALPEEGGVESVDREPHRLDQDEARAVFGRDVGIDDDEPDADEATEELAKVALRHFNGNPRVHEAIVDAVEHAVGTRDFPGDVDPLATSRLDNGLSAMFFQLIENAVEAKGRDAS